MTASFKPFVISEFKTGLFSYLEPWIRPNDAFQPLVNAYTYRGSIYKRGGSLFFGRLRYENNETIDTGTGGAGTYTGVLSAFPIDDGSMTVTVNRSGTIETFTDNGAGVLTGSLGDTGTINYTTGAWSITFGAAIVLNIPIVAGYTFTPSTLTTPLVRPIMGIKQWTDETIVSSKIVVMDTRRAAVYNPVTKVFDPLSLVSEQIGIGSGGVGPYTFTAGFEDIAPYSFTLTNQVESFTDNGDGTLTGSAGGNGTINYSSGAFTVTFNAATSAEFTIGYSLAGDYFTGNNTNFFNSTNWFGDLYLINAVDPITLYDGSTSPGTLSRPPFGITQANVNAYVNNIGACLDLDVYKNRLIVQKPTLVNNSPANGLFPQSFRWSAINDPTNLAADVAGNGGELSAPTDDFISSSEFVRDQLVVPFINSMWTFRFTGDFFDPFRWDKINVTKSTDSPYATVPFDEKITSVGKKGLIACDGVNVQRYDVNIIDFVSSEMNQVKLNQAFGTRYDVLNQAWILYVSSSSDDTTQSDRALVYNFLEQSFATYAINMSCLGTANLTTDATWADFGVDGYLYSQYPDWASADVPWNNFLQQKFELYGGDADGVVSVLNTGNTDNGAAIEAEITSTRWNPFIGIGERVQFGYIDIYYEINPDVVFSIEFFTNNSSTPSITRTLTLDGPTNSDTAFKRIYINLNGEFIQMKMTDNSLNQFKILGMVLWASKSGRLTPGGTN